MAEMFEPEFLAVIKGIILEKIIPGSFSAAQIDDALEKARIVNELDVVQLLQKQDTLCSKCGCCCRICTPIAIKKDELSQISNYLSYPLRKMRRDLNITTKNGQIFDMYQSPCFFLSKDNVCMVYSFRPFVCRGFPATHMITEGLEKSRPTVPAYLVVICKAVQAWYAKRVIGRLISSDLPSLKLHGYDK